MAKRREKGMFNAISTFKKYRNLDEAKWAYLQGRDFKILNGPYFSIRDFNMMKKQVLGDKIDKVLGSKDRPIISIAVPINGVLEYFEVLENGHIK